MSKPANKGKESTTVYENSRESGALLNYFQTDSLLWKSVYASSKLTKSRLDLVSVSQIIKECKTKTLSLQNAALVVLALSRISQKKTRYILEECTKFLLAVNGKLPQQKPQKERRPIAGVNSTLINDEKFNQVSNMMNNTIGGLTSGFDQTGANMDHQFTTDNFDMDGFYPEPEAVRNSTEVSAINPDVSTSAIFNSSSTKASAFRIKRKAINDKVTELTADEIATKPIKRILKTNGNIEAAKAIIEQFSTQLFVDPSIVRALNEEIARFNAEVVRNSAVMNDEQPFDFDQPDFDFDQPVEQSSINFAEITDDFDITGAMATLSRAEQARLFFELLTILTAKTHTATQNGPFERITVTKQPEQ